MGQASLVPEPGGGTAASHPDPGLFFSFINRFLGSCCTLVDMVGSLSKEPLPV